MPGLVPGIVVFDSGSVSEALQRQTRAFFGRRKGHKLRARQAELLEHLLPKLALDLTTPPPADLRTLFADATDVQLEIGFGGGEHLVAEAERAPHTGFIGSEPFVNGMAKVLALIAEHDLKNIRLHHGDAAELIAWLPQASLARIDLIYPDPWPKRRHWKRRFIQDASIAALARLLRPGGEFRFATDIPDYAAWTLRHFARARQFTWTAERADDWRKPWPGFSSTRYELKAKRAGRTPCYLTFRKD
jgi:tRNA (guanine-N7-)-methyltransferase